MDDKEAEFLSRKRRREEEDDEEEALLIQLLHRTVFAALTAVSAGAVTNQNGDEGERRGVIEFADPGTTSLGHQAGSVTTSVLVKTPPCIHRKSFAVVLLFLGRYFKRYMPIWLLSNRNVGTQG